MTLLRLTFALAVLATYASTANAHSQIDSPSNFYWGIIHPFYELSVALIVIAFGIIVGRVPVGCGTTKVMLLYLITVLAVISFTIMSSFTLPDSITLGLAIVLGICVAADLRLPLWLLIVMALTTALAASSTSPPDLPSWRENLIMAAGTWLGLTLVPIYLIVIVRQLKQSWHLIGVRILGSWITACSALVLCLKFSKLVL